MSTLLDDEPLLNPNEDRKAILPIKYPDIWQFVKNAQASIWPAEEIDLSKDLAHWERLPQAIKDVVETVFAFFSGADAIVNENLAANFFNRIQIPEVKAFYAIQLHIEVVHNETYSMIIINLIRDPERRHKLLNAITTMPGITKLYDWAQRWIKRTAADEGETNPILIQYAEEGAPDEIVEDLAEIWAFSKQLVAFACVEGIMFSGAFAIIFWLKEQGILPGLTFSNELISRDEGMHYSFACHLYKNYVHHKPPPEQVRQIVLEAISMSQELIGSCLARLNGLNKEDMNKYLEFVGDKALRDLGLSPHFGTKNPFPFMDKTAFNGLTNFFERKVAEYSKAGFEKGDEKIELDDDY